MNGAPEIVSGSSSSSPVRMVRLEDGRRVAYREYGAPDGWPVLALHGTPGSGLMYGIAATTAAELDLRLIAPDRWGYGRTDPHPRPSLEAWARDMAEIADRLDLPQLSLVGISGGSPYAVATAAMLGSRVVRLALAVPVGPIAGAASEHQLGLLHRLAYLGVGRRPRLVQTLFGGYRRLLHWSPGRAMSLIALGQSRSDRQLLKTPAIQKFLSETFRDGLGRGSTGPAIDLELFSNPWNIPLQGISSATRIWIGDDDRLVPLSAARRLAAMIPGAELIELKGRGHFWIAQEYRQVLEWLAAGQNNQVRQ